MTRTSRNHRGQTPRQFVLTQLKARLAGVARKPSDPSIFQLAEQELQRTAHLGNVTETAVLALAWLLGRDKKRRTFFERVRDYIEKLSPAAKSRLITQAWKEANPQWKPATTKRPKP